MHIFHLVCLPCLNLKTIILLSIDSDREGKTNCYIINTIAWQFLLNKKKHFSLWTKALGPSVQTVKMSDRITFCDLLNHIIEYIYIV